MLKSRKIAGLIAGCTTVVALALLLDRGGLILWSALLLGLALLAKIWLKPSSLDLWLAIGIPVILGLAWVGTFYYVISGWESGEVEELAIDTGAGTHTARVWVLDIGVDPVVYYDAPPDVAAALLAGTPLQFTRESEVNTRIPQATPVEELAEAQANLVLEAMEQKYGELNDLADIYYLMLGRSRDQVALVVSLIEP